MASEVHVAELLNSVERYTRYKVTDGLAPLASNEGLVEEGVRPPAAGERRNAASAISNAAAVAEAQGELQHDVNAVLYTFFRRWLSFHGKEAICALLEDIVQYAHIRHAASRGKW